MPATLPAPVKPDAPFAFLSSLYTELKGLRRDVYNLKDVVGNSIWVAEHSEPELVNQEPLEIVDTLIERVRQAHMFICIFAGSRTERDHGSPVPLGDRQSHVSYFEVELYQAALQGKPIHLFLAEGYAPGPRMQALIKALRWAMPEALPGPMSQAEILKAIERLLVHPPRVPRRFPRRPSRLQWLVGKLDDDRSSSWRQNGDYPDVLFLDGVLEPRSARPDKDLIQSALSEAAKQRDQERKLARIWIALRELMAAPYLESRYQEYRPLWNEALGRWASAGAWYGLHGHLYMGCLAALRTMATVRELIRPTSPGSLPPESVQHPGGPIASAHYSIAKLSPTSGRRRKNFEKALGHLQTSLAARPSDESGLLAIRGSVHLQLGNASRAVEDYEAVLQLRQKAGEDAGRIGEALSELGFGYLRQGRLLKGRDYLEQGVRLLASSDRVEFLVRAREKLAVGYAVTGRILKARQAWQEARQLAAQAGMLGRL